MSTQIEKPSKCVVLGCVCWVGSADFAPARPGGRRIKAIQDGDFQDAGRQIGRHVGGVVVDPIGDALMVDAEKPTDFAQAEVIQIEAERL